MFPSPSHTGARGPDLAQAEQLLRDLATISFRDTAHVKTVEYTLSALADWRPESQAGSEALAVRWVERIYAELESLPLKDPYMDIHRKGLRRLHDLCGRVQRAPSAFEVIDTFQPRTPDPQHYTALSDVYRTTDGTRTVALKRLRASQNEASALRKKFAKEAVVWKLLRHENIVPFLGVLRPEIPTDPVFLVSEYMENGTLTDFLLKFQEDPIGYIRHVVDGLHFIHTLEMVHGDLKGANVLVDSHRRARIADFGHTVSMMSTALPSSAWQSGTAAYMAPELYETNVDSSGIEQSRRPDAYSDVFALAMLMWEVYAGCYPFHPLKDSAITIKVTVYDLRPLREAAARLKDINDHRMNQVWSVIERSWSKEIDRRLSVEEIKASLEGL